MKFLLTNILKCMAGVPNIPPRLTNQQCVTILYLKRNLFSTNIKSQSETKLKDSNKINLKVMFFGTDGFALGIENLFINIQDFLYIFTCK